MKNNRQQVRTPRGFGKIINSHKGKYMKKGHRTSEEHTHVSVEMEQTHTVKIFPIEKVVLL